MSNPVERDEPAWENQISLRLATGPLVGPVLCRVISMVLARADWPMDRLDDVLIVCDTLSAHAPAYAADGHLDFAMSTDGAGLKLRVGALAEQGAERLVADALVPGVGNVLERMTDELRRVPAADGSDEELLLSIDF